MDDETRLTDENNWLAGSERAYLEQAKTSPQPDEACFAEIAEELLPVIRKTIHEAFDRHPLTKDDAAAVLVKLAACSFMIAEIPSDDTPNNELLRRTRILGKATAGMAGDKNLRKTVRFHQYGAPKTDNQPAPTTED